MSGYAPIDEDATTVTLVHVFSVEQARCQDLLDLLTGITDNVMRHQPGFLTASTMASRDGTRVVNLAQWASEDAYQAVLSDAEGNRYKEKILAIATADRRLYDVVAVRQAIRADRN